MNDLKVILCANSKPALNDVTYGEMISIVERIGHFSAEMKSAVEQKRLLLAENGQGSPCLDLRLN